MAMYTTEPQQSLGCIALKSKDQFEENYDLKSDLESSLIKLKSYSTEHKPMDSPEYTEWEAVACNTYYGLGSAKAVAPYLGVAVASPGGVGPPPPPAPGRPMQGSS